ncbi:MAG: aspartate oxidase, partial [Solirubrobacteraceae bacterium]
LGEPATSAGAGDAPAAGTKPPALTTETRDALWRYAGLERSRDGLRRLVEDPYPLARLIARCALAREESRGAHLRTDFPNSRPELDGVHVTLSADCEPDLVVWK